MTPVILTDKSRLQEIYDLRVYAWENSDRPGTISKENFPNGWYEDVDDKAYHFVIFDELDKIISSARISLHNRLEELPYQGIFDKFTLPEQRPFAFYSRLVVSPLHRGKLLTKKTDEAIISFLKEHKIHFTIATCQDRRLQSLLNVGFKTLGRTTIDKSDIGEETAIIYENGLH